MYKKHKFDIIIIFALLAFSVSLYLAISHYMNFLIPCSVTKGCESVLSSKYSSVYGIPLSVLGVAYFAGVIVTALLANHYIIFRRILTIFLGIGALFSLVFLFLQFFVIKKVCQYCLVIDFTGILLLIFDINIEHDFSLENKNMV